MPTVPLLDDEGRLRWDASSLLLATIVVPDDPALRGQYEAALRLETARGLPSGEQRLKKRDWVLAKAFERRPHGEVEMQSRRVHAKLAGAMLWDLHTAANAHPEIASKNKVTFAIDRVSAAAGTIGARGTLRKAWRQFRPVIHWCAALAYQSRVFGTTFPQIPEIGYLGDVVVADFLTLSAAFLAFAKSSVEFPEGASRSFWAAPKLAPIEPRHPEWPDAHVIVSGLTMDPEFLEAVTHYEIETDRIGRDWVTPGPTRRFALGKAAPKNS